MRAPVVLTLGAALILAGCSLLEPGSALQDDLTARRGAWESLGYTDFAYTMAVRCVCTGIVDVPTRVTVTNSGSSALAFVSSGDPVPAEYHSWYLTIDQLFDAIQQAIDDKAELISVVYHPDLHYPSSVVIDYSLIQVVEEVGYEISDLVPAGSPSSTMERVHG
ncbi:MAG: DUF6174 domain-containing protein [Gemmatimonadota bacterium]|nr:DUF6174 domain-containing protein [Gemmatimonadota bacterium]MDH3366983.1 DUF6174 domain-containing protein [Gemmatimonadota bacterium]MDH3476739.1 DUF6174 domain-containing protein [Gemmatimonadota bacterium]MDH3569934.1 DUF6174 domain-containing protein [Gemmatimonadota bacterium]MDH5551104.1 DUF6174 domain-containing protein [Gemmatimonadota bacterium]